MKKLISGSTGMLGGTAKKFFDDVGVLDRSELDLSNCSHGQLTDALNNKNFDYLINCAGLIKQRSVKDSDMISVNAVLPHRLAEFCKSTNKKMFHITTDCVFSGDLGSYDESSEHDASDVYGLSKSLGEPNCCMVIRTSIIGEEEKNKLSLLEWVKSKGGDSIDGYLDHHWNGVTCLQLCKVIKSIIDGNRYREGVHHIFSNRVNKFELVSMINNIYNLNITITPKSAGYCDRTLTTNMQDPFIVPELTEQIEETRKFHEHIR